MIVQCVKHGTTFELALGEGGCSQCVSEREQAKIQAEIDRLAKIPPVDRSAQTLTDGSPVTDDHREIIPDGMRKGQQKGYVVLSAAERVKGFVRPYRETYRHVGARPKFPTRELTDEEKTNYRGQGYAVFEIYPESESPKTGRFWTEQRLKSGCQATTTMGRSIAETYARDPGFYSGTFCCQCGAHFPLEEFVWEGTDERVGS